MCGLKDRANRTDQVSQRIGEWTIRHFSQANPTGPGQDDVPALLGRVADSLSELGDVEVQDLVLHSEDTAEGDWKSVTVYFYRKTD